MPPGFACVIPAGVPVAMPGTAPVNAILSSNGNSTGDGDNTESPNSEHRTNPTKGESEIWRSFDNAGNGRKQSGNGSKRQYYEWDHTHNDIEVYDKKGNHLSSMDPTTGKMYKLRVKGRDITI
jgi:hypothetical protein